MTLFADQVACVRSDHLVFEDISFDLSPGAALWVRGRNGAGKSSLLRICARLLRPAAGRLLWSGQEIGGNEDTYQGQYHYLGHQDPLKSVLTVKENLNFWANFHGTADVARAIADFELEPLQETPMGLLSAGQKKRVNLARLTASPLPLWILDEPLSALDQHYIQLFKSKLEQHLLGGGMALFATHQDLELAGATVLDLDKETAA